MTRSNSLEQKFGNSRKTTFAVGRRVAVIATLLAACVTTWAQDFPSKPIRIIVGAAAGGGSDNISRKVGQIMQQQNPNVNVVIENRPGASGSISVLATMRAAPDGYTLTICPPDTIAVFPQLKKTPPYTAGDLTAIAKLAEVNYIFVVPVSNPANNVEEFVRAAKAQGRPLNYGSDGPATSARMVSELFIQRTGLQMQQVPYQGSAPMLMALANGETSFSTTAFVSAKALIDAGKIKAIGIINDKRLQDFPNVPTAAEGGVRDMDLTAWFGIFGPKGIPPEITARLGDMFSKAVASDEFREWAKARGITAKPEGSAEFDRSVKANLPVWAAAIKASGFQLED